MARIEVYRNAGEIKSLPNLLTRVRRVRKKSPTGAVWLRGLSKENYALVPTIGRKCCFAGRKKTFDRDLEWRMLHQFRRHSFEFFDRALTEWETLFVGRHHGLPVRLLDWTSDPLAALYFACEFKDQNQPPNAKIWLLIPNQNSAQHLDVFSQNPNPFHVKGVKLLYPMAVAARIKAQRGLFTIQENPWKSLEELGETDYSETDLDVLRLIEFVVPGADRPQRLKELNDIGITRQTLFPDLDGLSSGIVNSEILRG